MLSFSICILALIQCKTKPKKSCTNKRLSLAWRQDGRWFKPSFLLSCSLNAEDRDFGHLVASRIVKPQICRSYARCIALCQGSFMVLDTRSAQWIPKKSPRSNRLALICSNILVVKKYRKVLNMKLIDNMSI